MNEQELTNLLEKRISMHANTNIEKYIQEVAVWISKVLLSKTKINVSFEYEPPYDSSGQIYDTNRSFDIRNYVTLDSFIDNEYNDTSYASYVSGMGIFHEFYSTELDELTNNWVVLQVEETVDSLLKEKNHLLIEYVRLREDENSITCKFQYSTADEISKLIYADDIIGDFLLFNYPIELKRRVGQIDIMFLFKLGHNLANDELKKEEITRQTRKEIQITNQRKAENCWNKICRLHKIRYQKEMPQKIEKDHYEQYLYPLLREELKENKDISDIRLLGDFLGYKFSNSVALKLINYK